VRNGAGPSTAVQFGAHRISYEELDTRSDAIAHALSHQAVGEAIIGVSTTRSIDVVIFVLGILKAGRFYLPLDPAHPKERLQQIISDSGIRHIASTPEDFLNFADLGLTLLSPLETNQ